MTDYIRIDVTGERQVGLRFDQFPDALYADLRKEIEGLGDELRGRIQAATPTDTGRLRAEERLRIFADPNRITAYMDVAAQDRNEIVKAAAEEYGAHKPHKVKAHQMRLDHLWEEKLAAPITVLVKALPGRVPNITATEFLRGPLAEMQPEVATRLNAAVERAVADANR